MVSIEDSKKRRVYASIGVTRNTTDDFHSLRQKYIIGPIVLNGCETWSLTLREVCRLRVFENRILRRVFGPKRDENGEWRRHHNEMSGRTVTEPHGGIFFFNFFFLSENLYSQVTRVLTGENSMGRRQHQLA